MVRIEPALRSRFRAFPVELQVADAHGLDRLVAAHTGSRAINPARAAGQVLSS